MAIKIKREKKGNKSLFWSCARNVSASFFKHERRSLKHPSVFDSVTIRILFPAVALENFHIKLHEFVCFQQKKDIGKLQKELLLWKSTGV